MVILMLLSLSLFASCLALWVTSLKYRSFPGLGVPIFGHLYRVLTSITTSFKQFLRKVDYHHLKYGDTLCFWAGPFPIISTVDPLIMEELSAISNSTDKPFLFYGPFSDIFEGAFSSTVADDKWKHARKATVSSVNKDYMQMYHDVFVRRAKELLERLTSKEGSFDLHPLVMLMTGDIVIETLCGIDSNVLKNNNIELHEAIMSTAAKVMNNICIQTFMRISPEDIKKITHFHLELAQAVIDNNINGKNKLGFVPMLSKLIVDKDGALISKDEIINAVLETLIEAQYTSGICLSAAFLFLAMYPEYQEKVLQEQLDIFGNSNADPTLEDLKKMQYLEMAIKDAVRIMSAPAFCKEIRRPIQIGSFTFPEKSRVIMFWNRLKKNPKYWKHPDRFYPDHFLPEEVSSRPKAAYFAFSSGHRRCPGREYFMCMSKIVLSITLRRLKMSSPLKQEELRYDPGPFMQLVGPHTVSVQLRESLAAPLH